VPKLFLTNAAGGLNRNFNVGDLMVLSAYFDLLNPKHRESGLQAALLRGSTACANELSEHIFKIGEELHAQDADFRKLQKGSYAALLGPSYETTAEIEMLRRLGADAVGMSTAPELLTAHNTATQAAAVSVITNVWKEGEIRLIWLAGRH
jgi:purine-nucleoside phosphorylase